MDLENKPPVNKVDTDVVNEPDYTITTPLEPEKKPGRKINRKIRRFLENFNIYLLVFVILVIFTVIFTIWSYFKQNSQDSPSTTTTQELDAESLRQLKNTDATVGDPKQILTVQSDSIFNGKVLVRDNLDVAGTIKVGGTLNVAGIIVSGISTLDQIQGNKLNINGDGNFQGQLTVLKGITISGGATFGSGISAPTITTDSLQLNGDLRINRHINSGGSAPGISNGSALGSGGTSSIAGGDTAGTININTGSSPAVGCFVTITFSKNYNSQPHIVVSPVGSSAAGLNFYVNKTNNGFSLCTTNSAPSGVNFSFDYIVIG